MPFPTEIGKLSLLVINSQPSTAASCRGTDRHRLSQLKTKQRGTLAIAIAAYQPAVVHGFQKAGHHAKACQDGLSKAGPEWERKEHVCTVYYHFQKSPKANGTVRRWQRRAISGAGQGLFSGRPAAQVVRGEMARGKYQDSERMRPMAAWCGGDVLEKREGKE